MLPTQERPQQSSRGWGALPMAATGEDGDDDEFRQSDEDPEEVHPPLLLKLYFFGFSPAPS